MNTSRKRRAWFALAILATAVGSVSADLSGTVAPAVPAVESQAQHDLSTVAEGEPGGTRPGRVSRLGLDGSLPLKPGGDGIIRPIGSSGSRAWVVPLRFETLYWDYLGPWDQLHTVEYDLRVSVDGGVRTVSGLTMRLSDPLSVWALNQTDPDTLEELGESFSEYSAWLTANFDPDPELAIGWVTEIDWCDRDPGGCNPPPALSADLTTGSMQPPLVLCPGEYVDLHVTVVGSPQLDDGRVGLDFEGTMVDFCFDVCDVQGQFRDMAGIETDPEKLAEKCDKALAGIAADGVTPILIRFAAHGPGTVSFTTTGDLGFNDGLGRLSAPADYDPAWYQTGGDVGTLDVDTVPVIGDGDGQSPAYAAFVVLTAPPDYSRVILADEANNDRKLTIEAVFTPSGDGDVVSRELEISVVRAPVMLLHGLWGSAASWGWWMQDDARFTVHEGDYKDTNMMPWIVNTPSGVRADVRSAIQKLRGKNIAVTQADVFTSSMGGLLMRKYIADRSFTQDDNFGQGDIHKFITVDTPHQGSPWANELVEADGQTMTTFGQIVQTAAMFTEAVGCVNCGAVGDLRTDSPVVTTLPETSVRCHAIVGNGGHRFIWDFDLLPDGVLRALCATARFLGLDIEQDILGTYDHDVIVTKDSQLGGLTEGLNSTTVFPFSWDNFAIHMSYGGNDDYSDKAVELIHKPLYGTGFAAGFPAASKSRATPPTTGRTPREVIRGSGDQIEIGSPAPGAIVTPGSTLPVTVEPLGGYVPVRVLVMSMADSDLDSNGTPFEMALEVPDDAIGDITLLAFSLDAGDVLVESNPVTVHVSVSADLTGLSVIPDEQFTFAYCPGQNLRVMGHYDDGVNREITSAALGTTYATDNPLAATVDSNGLITTYYVGSATITVTNGAHEATTEVHVIGANGDADFDADSDLADHASFLDCMDGPGVGFSPLACEVMDFDHDGDVDLADFAGFQARFTGNFDCNGNGVSDSADIASRNSLDRNVNGLPDECEPDCDTNGVPDDLDIAAGTSKDRDGNSVPDVCDPDCNTNGSIDWCDITCAGGCADVVGCGQSYDCQADGVPDECQLAPVALLSYRIDDGAQEGAIGMPGGGYMAWLNHFTVEAAAERIGRVRLAWGAVAEGTSATVYLWSDPNGDGDPADAQVLSSARTLYQAAAPNTFTVLDLPDRYVGPAGTSFFIGAIVFHSDGEYPAPLDETSSQGQSWLAANGAYPIDPNDLGAAGLPPNTVDNLGFAGNWLLRAEAIGPGGDCNTNGVPDQCDFDCNTNAIPDECELVAVEVLIDSGPILTHPGAGVGLADVSVLQSAIGMSTLGVEHGTASGNRVADDFVITENAGWHIDTITFYAYQVGSTTTSTITGVNLRIWDGEPGSGAEVVFGDTGTNRMIQTGWSGIYRTSESLGLADTDRPVMANVVAVDLDLAPGTYWLDWQAVGSLPGGTWAVPITIWGSPTTGDGLMLSGSTWVPLLDAGLATPQGLPFSISGGAVVDCNGNLTVDECDITVGTSLDTDADGIPDECQADCNSNGVADFRDIAGSTSADCNGNGVPDECEPDCNTNAVPDDCDIVAGTSLDCNSNDAPDECDIAFATSVDCNTNQVPDECDLAELTSSDCDSNGVPDECEPDCNTNGVTDACDVALKTSPDCNSNGTPDECETECNDNNVPDDCDIAGGTSLDLDTNGVPDECETDCNTNGAADFRDIAAGTSPDCNNNAVPDECEADCNTNGVADECDVVAGTSADCNGNGAPDECEPDCNTNGTADECDVTGGTSLDCNLNHIPDECEPDCNENSTPDQCDIAAGTSPDLDSNGVPDECETDCNSNGFADFRDISAGTSTDCDGNGVPDECDPDCNLNGIADGCDIASGTSVDCNGDSVPDECSMVLPFSSTSPDFQPLDYYFPYDYTIIDPPLAAGDVTLTFTARGDLSGSSHYVRVMLNGVTVGDAYDSSGSSCSPVTDELVVPASTFNTAISGGDVTITMDPPWAVSWSQCWYPQDTYIRVAVNYVAVVNDCNYNGVLDACDAVGGTSADCDGNAIPDECEADCNTNGVVDACDITGGTSTDCDGNGAPDDCQPDCNGNEIADSCDIAAATSEDCNTNGMPDECEADCDGNGSPDDCDYARVDCNGNGTIDGCDLATGQSTDCDGNGTLDECDIAGGTILTTEVSSEGMESQYPRTYGVNSAAQVVGYASFDSESHAALWEAGVMSELVDAGSVAYGINDAEQVVGTVSNSYAFLWEDGVVTALPGDTGAVAFAVNNVGQIAGTSSGQAALWDDGELLQLGRLGHYSYGNEAHGVNDLGQVVGVSKTYGGVDRAFLYEDGAMTELEVFDGPDCRAEDVNNVGLIVGSGKLWRGGTLRFYDDRAFLWEDGTAVNLGAFGMSTQISFAKAINGFGQAVGGTTYWGEPNWTEGGYGSYHGFLWRDGVMVDLNDLLPGVTPWQLSSAEDISEAGHITGMCYNSGTDSESGYLMTVVWSQDCNANGMLDVCELAASTAADCNSNGLLDECDLDLPFRTPASPQLAPFSAGSPQDHTVVAPPLAYSAVTLKFFSNAQLEPGYEYVDVELNDTHVGVVFDEGPPAAYGSYDELVVPAATYNAALAGGDLTIEAIIPFGGGEKDDAAKSLRSDRYVRMSVEYTAIGASDCNANSIPDECDIATGGSQDTNVNGIPDECE